MTLVEKKSVLGHKHYLALKLLLFYCDKMCNIQTMCFKVNICFFQNPYTIHILFSFWAATSTTVPMTFQLLKNCSLTLTITI